MVMLVLGLLGPLPPDGSGGLEVLELVVVAFPWAILLCLFQTKVSWVKVLVKNLMSEKGGLPEKS